MKLEIIRVAVSPANFEGTSSWYLLPDPYTGSGTEEDSYLVTWIPHDPQNPMLWPNHQKWTYTVIITMATLVVAFVSSVYMAGVARILHEDNIGTELSILGVALVSLLALGPLLWAPLSETWGREPLLYVTICGFSIFNAACMSSTSIWLLLIFRLSAASFGLSALTITGGVISDIFPASERGPVVTFISLVQSLGPVLELNLGGLTGMTTDEEWVTVILAILAGIMCIGVGFSATETYTPVILQQRASKLSKATGKVFQTKYCIDKFKVSARKASAVALRRAWAFLLKEPIVLLSSVYMGIIYDTLSLSFGVFPILYSENNGLTQCTVLGMSVGVMLGVIYSIYTNPSYIQVQKKHNGLAPPDARLPVTTIASFLPVGLFWLAWMNSPSVYISVVGGISFGGGMVLIFLGFMNYLVDLYTMYTASVLAANLVLRSFFGMILPVFIRLMGAIGMHVSLFIPVFLTLLSTAFPLVLYRYGHHIYKYSRYAVEPVSVEDFVRQMV